MKYYLKNNKKLMIIILLIGILCPLIGISYSNFIFSSNDYRASEMYIGNLLYGIKIDGEAKSSVSVPPGETEYTIEITSLNTVASFYKLMYKTNENINVMYNKDEDDQPSGNISNVKTIQVKITNNSSSNIEVEFDIAAGYNTNDLESVSIKEGYTEITNFYIVNDLNFIAMTIDGKEATSLSSDEKYYLSSYSCSNGETVSYNTETNEINIKSGIKSIPVNCSVHFKTVSSASKTLAEKILEDNTETASRTDFSTVFTEDTTGKIYYTSDKTESVCDSSDTLTYVSGSGENAVCKTYYFAGQNLSNFVSFGGHIWRIVRINEDQSVRLIYAGKEENYSIDNTDSAQIGNSAFAYSFMNIEKNTRDFSCEMNLTTHM